MKKHLLLALCFSFCTLFSTAQTSSPEKYSKISLEIGSQEDLTQYALLGIDFEHSEKIDDRHIALILSESELLQLITANAEYDILIEDMTAHFLKSNQDFDPAAEMDCGLANFDSGSIGGYHSVQEVEEHIYSMESSYSDIVQVIQIGSSYENRPIYAVKISDNVLEDESDFEGVVYYDALHHAREPLSLEATLYYMWWLLENYANNQEAQYLINHREIYFVPVVNPDGVIYNETTDPNGGGYWRKNRRESSLGCYGVDLNRNYSHGWGIPSGSSGNPCDGTYRGETPFSEPETQAVHDLLEEIEPSIGFTCHSHGQTFLSPFGYTDSLASYHHYAEFSSEYTPYHYDGYGTTAKMLGYTSSGTTRDYLHSEGIYGWTPEIGESFWEPAFNICTRVQNFLEPMKYLSWVSGNYPCYHDYALNNEDGFWTGDTISLNIRVKNRGLTHNAENVEVKLNSLNPAVEPVSDILSYGTMAPRSFAENVDPFLLKVTGDISVLEQIAIEVIVSQNSWESYRDTIFVSAGWSEEIAYDSAEKGLDNNWYFEGIGTAWDSTFMDKTCGEHAFADSRYGNYVAHSLNTFETDFPIDISNAFNPMLEFDAKWSLEYSYDAVFLEMSTDDGLSWIPLSSPKMEFVGGEFGYTGNVFWTQEKIDLSGFINASDNLIFRFILFSDGTRHSDGFYFDNFRVTDYFSPDDVSNTRDSEILGLQIELAPNPSDGQFSININAEKAIEADFKISNVFGQVVLAETKMIKTGTQHFKYDLSQYSNGIYFFEIEKEGKKVVRKILVQ